MADNTVLNTGSGGDTVRTLQDTDGVKWPAGVTAFTVSLGTPDVVSLVTATTGLPVHQQTGATWTVSATTLTSIDGKTPSLGQALAAASVPVVLTASQLTTLTPPAAITGFATSANQTTELASLASIDGKTPALGQALAAASVPVVLTASQLTTLTPPAAITGFATSAKQDTGNTSVASIDTKTPALGQALSAASVPVVLTAAQITTLTPPLTLTAVTTVGTITNVVHVDDNAGSLTVDGTVAISGTVTVGSHAVTNAGTFAVQAAGDVAHDGADSGSPVKVGAKATTALSALTLVSDADRTNLFAGVDGVQITRPHANLEDIVSGNASNTDGTSTQCIAAAASGIKQYLTSVVLTNMSATGIYVEIKSGTTVKATIPLPANSGAIFNPPVPLPPNAAAEAWNFDPSAAATTVYCSMIGFKSKV